MEKITILLLACAVCLALLLQAFNHLPADAVTTLFQLLIKWLS